MNHTSGAKRVKEKRDRGVYGKTLLFGLLPKRHTEIVPNCAQSMLQAIMDRSRSIIHSDSWHGYNGLIDLGYKKHYHVHYENNEFVNGKRHINGI
jgi:hypothetical protein